MQPNLPRGFFFLQEGVQRTLRMRNDERLEMPLEAACLSLAVLALRSKNLMRSGTGPCLLVEARDLSQPVTMTWLVAAEGVARTLRERSCACVLRSGPPRVEERGPRRATIGAMVAVVRLSESRGWWLREYVSRVTQVRLRELDRNTQRKESVALLVGVVEVGRV